MAGEEETQVWIKPAAAPSGPTQLSALDQLTAVTSTSRLWAFHARLDEGLLQAALQAFIDDLPLLGGR